MKRTFRYDKDSGRMIEVTGESRLVRTLHVMEDIKPYRAVGPEFGKPITSRSQHREYLRKHNLIEVGDQKDYVTGKKS